MFEDIFVRYRCSLQALLYRSPVMFCLCAFLLSRAFFWSLAFFWNVYFGLHLQPGAFFYHFDSFWYEGIAAHGYSATANYVGHVNYVFFPLLPLIVSVLSSLTHISLIWMGQVFCQCCFAVSLWLFYQVLQLRVSESAARWGVIILAFSPFNIYFSSFYTESLFLLLSLGVWLAVYRGQWLVVGVLAALLSATRPNGVMMIVPLLYFIFQAFRNKALKPGMFFVILAPLGLLGYMLFLYVHFGDIFAFLHSEQSTWGRSGWPLNPVIMVSQLFFDILLFPYDTVIFVIAVFLIRYLIRKQYFPEALYFMMMLLPALASGSFMSLGRFSGGVFTFYFALALLLQNKSLQNNSLTFILYFIFPFFVCCMLYVFGWLNGCSWLM